MSALIAASLLLGQISAPKDPPVAPRMEVIYNSMYNRMTTQASVWFEDGDYPKTINLLKIQSEVFPHDYEANTNLGWMLENVEQNDDALIAYELYRSRNPDDPDGALPVAQYYYLKKQWAKIPPILEPALTKTSHANGYRILAHAYERLGRLAESKATWEKSLELNPKDETARNNLRRVQSKQPPAGGR